MNTKVLKTLEFYKITARLAEHASTPLGRRMCEECVPLDDLAAILDAQTLTRDALARLYNVSVDNLIHYNQKTERFPIPPSGKHIFGTVKVGERGQVVLPKKARDLFQIKPGDLLVVLGDEAPGRAGIALTPADAFLHALETLQNALQAAQADCQKEDRLR